MNIGLDFRNQKIVRDFSFVVRPFLMALTDLDFKSKSVSAIRNGLIWDRGLPPRFTWSFT